MVEEQAVEQQIFEAARKLDSLAVRESCLQEKCGDDAELRSRVEALLRAYDRSESFLESPPLEFTLDQPFSLEIEKVEPKK